MKILLTTLNSKYIHINLAIRQLYQLNKEYKGIAWKEFTIKEDKDDVAEQCATFDVVAFSCYIWNITQTLEVAKKIKAINQETKILLGGPEVSYEWGNVIAKNEIDFIITGEGEIPFQEFLRSYPNVEQVSNLVRKVGNEVVYKEKSVLFDLKNYTNLMPYSDDVIEELKNKVLYVETSRGCPYKCEFCLASLDNVVRYLPNEHIKANLLFLMEHGRVVKFLDRTFNIKKDFTIDIFKFILEHHRPGNVFQFEITADIVQSEIIDFIHAHVPKGLFRFEIGIQTVNQKANLEVSRKQNFDKTKGIIQSLSGKIEMHLDLIVGLPFDYWEDIKYSFEEVFKLFAPELQLGFLKFLKGTPMRDKHKEHEFVFDPNPPYQIIESKYLSKEQLNQIVVVENALEIYWNKNKTIRTLKYVTKQYSIFDFLLGLGNYFVERREFHKYSLKDVYEIIFQFAEIHYSNDNTLKQLIAIDYYLQAKIKPQTLFLEEIPLNEKRRLIEKLNLNHHKFRYIILPVEFDLRLFEKESTIENNANNLIIQYNGTSEAEVIFDN
ncbi:MAG: B12-binding domain-containing radical SAM protein [Bacteroidetes bacterium RIFCSPLOWO2_12_FULL_35_15]|nr:MAG: B12-binding domain-containing radical SAM protein [Bacteroidetes bacterium RIFCSPLOWO2_12_FULL_35_15]